MQARKIHLSVYQDALEDFHIQKTEKPLGAEMLHFHDYYQIYFVNHGTLTHHYQNVSKQMWKGDAFIIPPNQNHRIEIHEKVIFYSISFFTSFLDNSKNEPLKEFLRSLEPNSKNPLIVQPKVALEPAMSQTFETLLDLMFREYKSNNAEKTYVLRGLLTVITAKFLHAYNSFTELQDVPPRNHVARNVVMAYIETLKNEFAQPHTLEDAVHETLLNKSLFCRMFLESTGTTFNKYINSLRIHKAAELILTTTSTIEEIAEISGYCNYVTFYRNFHDVIGVSPAKYRAFGNRF